MIIKVNKQELVGGLMAIVGVVTTKNTLPILSNILIQTKEGVMELVATDLDVGIVTAIGVEVIEDGAITIPAKKFTDIVKELPEALITITTKKNNTVNIECESAFFKIMGIPKDEFPKLPKLTSKTKITLPQINMKKMLTKAIIAVSRDQTRHVLNGILFIIDKSGVKIVATDGRRLVIIKKDIELSKDINIKEVVPAKAIQEVNKIIQDNGEMVISFDENQVMFSLDNTIVISRLIEGEFPNYEQAIPTQSKDKLIIDKKSFLFAVKRAALLTTPDSQAVKLDVVKDKIIVSKHTPNIGEAKEELECSYTGGEFSIGFNPNYLLDGLKNIEQDQLNIEFSGSEKPALTKDEDGYTYIVLPMQIT